MKLSKVFLFALIFLFSAHTVAIGNAHPAGGITSETNIHENVLPGENLLCAFCSAIENQEAVLFDLYQSEIAETQALGATWDIEYLYLDLNEDGTEEILAYFTSIVTSGSQGVFRLDVWCAAEAGTYVNIGPDYKLCLNPRFEELKDVTLQMLPDSQNGYAKLQYQALYGKMQEERILFAVADGRYSVCTEDR